MTKILYVEDNEDNVYMLRRRLERAGLRGQSSPPTASRGCDAAGASSRT